MSVFVEKYLGSITIPMALVVGAVAQLTGSSFWLTALPVLLALGFFIQLVQVGWRLTLILKINDLGYCVNKTDRGWGGRNLDGVPIGPNPSLTKTLAVARLYQQEERIRGDEQAKLIRRGWQPPLTTVTDGVEHRLGNHSEV